jgi:hypothetical protein
MYLVLFYSPGCSWAGLTARRSSAQEASEAIASFLPDPGIIDTLALANLAPSQITLPDGYRIECVRDDA